MQRIKIVFFDRNVLEENLRKHFKHSNIISSSICFTYGMLRRFIREEYAFYKSKTNHRVIFGKLYEIDIHEEDMLSLDIFYTHKCLEEIEIYKLNDVKDIYKCKYEVINKEKAYVYLNNDTSRNNRHNNCGNMSKYLLLEV